MAGVVPAEYRAVVLEQQRALAKLVHQAGVGPTKKLYDKMLADLEAKLRRTATGTLTHLQARGMLAQVKLGMARVLQAMKGQFAESATTIGIEQATRALRDVARLERQFTGALVELPLLETARLSGLVEGQVSSMLRAHDTSMGKYGVHLVNQFEETLGAAVSRGDTTDEAITAVTKVGQLEWWRGERIVRCLPGDTVVTGAVVRAVHRRWHDGHLVEIVTERGRKLSATANHPVLTMRGWVGAGLVRDGDDLLCDLKQERASATSDQDVARRPSTIREIFDAASAVGIVRRRRGAEPDFHGDGSDRDVDVAYVDRELLYGVFAELTEPACEHLLSPSDVLTGRLGYCPLCRRLLPSERSCFCLGPDGDAPSFEAFVDHVHIDAERVGDLRRRFAGDVSSNDFINRNSDPVARSVTSRDPGAMGLAQGPYDARAHDVLLDAMPGNSDGSSNLYRAQPGGVERDRVIDVRLVEFSGHVYNLTTNHGYFSSNGINVGNTELAYSTNRSARAAIEEQSEELGGDLWMRWCEHVTDGGQPMDDRVGVDSEAMHGQVAPPGAKFTQPPRSPKGEEVGESLAGEEFLCPPNRPNDRAVLVPWRPHWGVPGWLWRDGRRVPATEAVVRAAIHWRPRPAPEVEVAQAAPEPSVVVVPDEPKKNPRRVEAGRRAGEASAERTREIHSAVKSNLPSELLVAWNKEGHKFLRQEGGRIRGIKDPINAASKISEAFAETYGSGAETTFGNEGDRFFKRAELEAEHAESWADEQERKYYAAAQREATEGGEITESGRARVEAAKRDHQPPSADDDDDTPF